MAENIRDSLVMKAREYASQREGPYTRDGFLEFANIPRSLIEKVFRERGWRQLARLADIPPHPNAHGKFDRNRLLEQYHSLVQEEKALPLIRKFSERVGLSRSAIHRGFRRSGGIENAYREWLMENEPDSPFLKLIPSESGGGEPVAPSLLAKRIAPYPKSEQRDGDTEYGPPMNFRGLQHAPVNELGVVYLFGMVAQDLHFIVESIHPRFPDCEAKHCSDPRRNRWRRVRIEFEYLSSNFRDHRHDPKGCQYIVCWEHDWADCPVAVIELRSEIEKLKP